MGWAPMFRSQVLLPEPGSPTTTMIRGRRRSDNVMPGVEKAAGDGAAKRDGIDRLVFREAAQNGHGGAQSVAFGTRGEDGAGGDLNARHRVAQEHRANIGSDAGRF